MVVDNTPSSSSTSLPAQDAAAGQRPRIMLAEDDADLRTLLATALGDYRIASFDSGTALLGALERAARDQEPPALVISDERMPGMSGLRALQRIRDWGWNVPLILITSFGDDGLAARAKSAGVTLLRKPFELDELRALVRSQLACATCGSTSDLRSLPERGPGLSCDKCRAMQGVN